jgi:hypothetical protein
MFLIHFLGYPGARYVRKDKKYSWRKSFHQPLQDTGNSTSTTIGGGETSRNHLK